MKGQQMYKIYVNRTKVTLLPSTDVPSDFTNTDKRLISVYSGKTKSLFNFIDMFEKSRRIKECIIHYHDFEILKKDFQSLYRVVPAGGGLVKNEKDEILFIFRRGSWDLPKGKLDADETKRAAAVREVEEETGIQGVSIVRKLTVTNHTYRDKKERRCIKKSHWYLMTCKDQPLTPQTEEDIEEACWLTLESFDQKEGRVYKSISDVLETIR